VEIERNGIIVMSTSTAREYLELFTGDEQARLALLACSASLQLDDKIAYSAVEMVAQSNGATARLVQRVKSLGCVWKEWNGLWHVTEDVRPHLMDHLYQDVPRAIVLKLHQHLAESADSTTLQLPLNGQVTNHAKLLSRFEAAYQRVHIPEQRGEGAAQLAELWQHSPPGAANATARSVDYLAEELDRRLGQLPEEVVFLRGMAARSRGDRKNEEKYFRQVWERGHDGYIYAIAAHLFGLLIKNRDAKTAERAMRDSIEWNQSPRHHAQVYHSLGNLYAKDRERWQEAEQAFRRSIYVDNNNNSRAQTLHSLANLLAKDRIRRKEAEGLYSESLRIDSDNYSRAEALHSLGNFLGKDRYRMDDAARAYRASIDLRADSQHQKQVYHSLGNLLTKEPTYWKEAEAAFRQSLKRAEDNYSRAQILHSFGKLLFKMDGRRAEAESLLEESLKLYDNPAHQAQVLGTWAVALSEMGADKDDVRAEEYALRGLELAPRNPQNRGILYRVLARIYERRRDYYKAIQACEGWKEANVKLRNQKFAKDAQAKIEELTKKMELDPKRKPR